MVSTVHNPDRKITNNYYSNAHMVFSGLIQMEEINPTCIPFEEASYQDIDCEGSFIGDEIIQCTLQQLERESVCKNFYITAKMVYDENLRRYVARIWLWGDLATWEPYANFYIFVNIFQNTGCLIVE